MVGTMACAGGAPREHFKGVLKEKRPIVQNAPLTDKTWGRCALTLATLADWQERQRCSAARSAPGTIRSSHHRRCLLAAGS